MSLLYTFHWPYLKGTEMQFFLGLELEVELHSYSLFFLFCCPDARRLVVIFKVELLLFYNNRYASNNTNSVSSY